MSTDTPPLSERIALLRTVGGNEIIRDRPTGQQRSQAFREMLSPFLGDIAANLVEAALRPGDPDLAACKALLERLVPLPRARAENPGLKIRADATLAEQSRDVVNQIAEGADLDAAAGIINALNASVKIAEQTELQQRLDALEQAATAPPTRTASVTPLRAVANGAAPSVDISDLA